MNIRFSVITPVYNRADCITRCLDSVLNQDFENYELIVINDGSTDDTIVKADAFRTKIKNLNIISYTDNKGVNFARNRGIEQVKGEFIIFLDSDDQLTENALSIIEQQIKLNPDFSHYLFGVSDRIDDKTIPKEIRKFSYRDWLSGVVTGDFAHVIKPECFEGLLFVEEFRIYESLNWLRVLRQNKTLLFIPTIIFDRERNRNDSVTREAILDNRISMRNNYEYIINLIEMYSEDYIKFNAIDSLNYQIRKGLLLGIALGENKRNAILFKHFEFKKRKLTLLKLVNYNFFSTFVYFLIMIRSKYNQRLNIGK